ncbi:hypothetical protein CYMTET_25268 [Cymbomonas tetramitiformis]|uniref:Uncharacterized protein n=1 Tax=Cymbomonas tetramitiformis TaxID=36881 RepID=A0AAE0FU66_9CHLO|nr:hypothetical protein CYMTET_25268 [Cymbomonas tetramitiformis]
MGAGSRQYWLQRAHDFGSEKTINEQQEQEQAQAQAQAQEQEQEQQQQQHYCIRVFVFGLLSFNVFCQQQIARIQWPNCARLLGKNYELSHGKLYYVALNRILFLTLLLKHL